MRSPMQHRHLTGDHLGAPEIADIIGRGTLTDWMHLRDAMAVEPELKAVIRLVCEAHLAMEEEDFPEEFRFWLTYLDQHE